MLSKKAKNTIPCFAAFSKEGKALARPKNGQVSVFLCLIEKSKTNANAIQSINGLF
jgi:hypothetical protein